jgi:hypothetical protein
MRSSVNPSCRVDAAESAAGRQFAPKNNLRHKYFVRYELALVAMAAKQPNRVTNTQAADRILRDWAHELRVRLDEIKGKTTK